MKYLSFLFLLFSLSAEAIGVSVLSNTAVKEKYGIRIELAEKSIEECNDYVIYAPFRIIDEELGLYVLEKIDSVLFADRTNQNEVLTEADYTNHHYESLVGYARVLGCVKAAELELIHFKFLYLNEGSPSIVIVAPLI